MRPSKQILHATPARYSTRYPATDAVLPSFHALVRTATLVAAFVFLGACVLGAI